MRKIQYILYVAFVALFFTACQEDDFGGLMQGGIRIALADGTTGVDVTTRSTPSELFDGFKKKFKFQIKGGDNYDQTHEWTEDVIPLAAGVYEIIATCGTEQAAGVVEFDKPCYTGKAEGIKVEVGKEAKAEVKCKVTNALVSIKFAEGYETYAENAYAMIAVGSGIETWAELSESAYFKAGSSLTKLVLYKNGSESLPADILTEAKKVSGFPETFKAGDHLILTLSVAKKNGNVSFKVSKVELKEVTIEETIPMEWLPKPSVSATGFDTNNSLTFAETETKEAKLDLKLASALQDIKFKFNFEDEQFSSLTKDKEYLLSTDKEAIEQALGISLPAIGATSASIDFAGLVAKLQSKADGATTNKIMIVPKANDRWSSEKTEVDSVYTFTCNKPEFSIAVQPGNVWTKTFTIDDPTVTAGNADVLKEKLVYQYKTTEESEWNECSNGLEQVFSKAPTNKEYQVRAFYREGIVSNVVDVELETPAQVPNANMDAWTSTTRITKYTLIKDYTSERPYYLPWNGDVAQWWDTNNNQTIPTTVSATLAYIDYKSFPTTTFETPGYNNSDKAVVIRSVAVDDWNSEAQGKGSTRGVLYAGATDNNGNMTEGRDWDSRPSKMTFMYKYDSQDGEHFGAYIELLAENDNSIASGNFLSEKGQDISTYIKAEVPITYSDTFSKVATIKIRFVSVADGESVYTGKQNITIPAGNYQIYGGSVLTIDDIQLIYDK